MGDDQVVRVFVEQLCGGGGRGVNPGFDGALGVAEEFGDPLGEFEAEAGSAPATTWWARGEAAHGALQFVAIDGRSFVGCRVRADEVAHDADELRVRWRRVVAPVLSATRVSQVARVASWRKLPRERYALMKVSWTISAASVGLLVSA
ncbi:MAG: hypothetical protein U0841_11780 [Chloroflexia bacterium]